MTRWLCILAAFACLISSAQGQVQITTELGRSTYMRYERVDLIVTLTNTSDSDIVLDNNENKSWLSFLVTRKNTLPVAPENQASFAPLTLKVGEKKRLKVNITPLFSFRDEVEYRVAAVVDLPGQGQMLSEATPFTVVEGNKVWSQTHSFEGAQLIYSLLRFQPQLDHSYLYLRVEDAQANIVYTNLSLGELASFVDPQAYFDPSNSLHILQPVSLGTYLYTRTDPQGKILHQGIFRAAEEVPPVLAKLDDGTVTVQGGIPDEETGPREVLSSAQHNSQTSSDLAH